MQKPLLTILLLCGLAVTHAQSGRVDRNPPIDSLVDLFLRHAGYFDDSAGWYADRALEESRKANYVHGIALATACKSIYTIYYTNDFIQGEQIARQSLDWFDRTANKDNITYAYYALGFDLYAQSRFEEAIHYIKLAQDYARQAGDTANVIRALSLIGCAHRESGDYEKAYEINRRCLQMAGESHHPELMPSEYYELAELFIQIEDYDAAKKYFHLGFGQGQPSMSHAWKVLVYAELLSRQGLFDSALHYYNRFDSAALKPAILRSYLVSKGEYYLLQDRSSEALPYFEKSLVYQRQLNDRNQVMRCLKDLSLANQWLGRDKVAAQYARESLAIAEQFKARQYIRDNCLTLYSLYDKAKRADSAYAFYRRYNAMKDSVNSEQLKGKFASWAYEQQIALLNKEKQLNEVCLRETLATKRLLIGGIIALLLIGFIFSRYVLLKRKNEAHLRKRAENELEIQRLEGEKAKAALQQRAKELEIQALRSQMNPHFIFNCLNAINRFILGHETEAASDYLTKFSRLMRMIMNHSRHSVISLAEELEVLQLYLDMERLRFKDAFDYNIVVEEELDAGDIYIPPLLLQPFVENAVWHGLMHKQERGLLTVTLRAEGDMLTCIIQDNGVGRQKAVLLKSKSAQRHKSMGLQITAERLHLLTGSGAPGHFFNIEDLYDAEGRPAGTRVVLRIRINSAAGEPA
ncbi:histidine kinase [Flavitalea sp. BT771]|uniref:tetratricopeptide repeat-containing sensor histidine kinase n=1 Tax=Flavitalea sp. BT771 TaxID=3063329 RepID=UPI0026E171CA|nr:histidine kinase [Flavitalea sp. BT771]MDO6429210.1 histidine kinase [Flavitalea sp. BT771]MDV6218662.1 histidine kinase [Flavitalea sp. BT771]